MVTIESASDLSAIQSCESLDGILIKDTAGMKDGISLPSLTSIGNLGLSIRSDSNIEGWEGTIPSLSMPNLEKVEGPLQIKNLLALSKIDLSKLTSVGSFGVSTAPRLQDLSFPSGLSSTGSSFSIVDTAITGTSLTGLQFHNTGTIDITSNPNLDKLSFPNLSEVTGPMKVALNGRSIDDNVSGKGSIVSADSLQRVAGDLILNWVSGLNLNSLSSVGGNLEVTEGSSNMTSLSLPKLMEIGKSWTVRSNQNLSTIKTPTLSTVHGSISFSNDPSLTSLPTDDFMPSIKTIDGSINLSLPGTLQTFTLPQAQIGGNLIVEGADTLDCNEVKRSAAAASMNLRDSVSCTTTSDKGTRGDNGGNSTYNSTHGGNSTRRRLPTTTVSSKNTKTLGPTSTAAKASGALTHRDLVMDFGMLAQSVFAVLLGSTIAFALQRNIEI
ncbi:hypothetical protein HDU97_009171 [Phlyctochytrium planicorne]|nr:hypothetical protein HDU97_009171 [Phlyctochytrium planicorne]